MKDHESVPAWVYDPDALRPPETDEEPWVLVLEAAIASRRRSGLIAALTLLAFLAGGAVLVAVAVRR